MFLINTGALQGQAGLSDLPGEKEINGQQILL